MNYDQNQRRLNNGFETGNGNQIRNTKDKGKGKENSKSDEQNTLDSLNQLLHQLSIPISLSNLSFTTPSLLLAILESLLERRFLNLNDPIRTSRTTQSREKCLKILLTILDESLDYELDQWSSSSINLTKLNQNHTHELIKLVNGLIKLSIKCNNPSIGLIEPSIQSDHPITFDNLDSPELNPIKFRNKKTSLPTSSATLTSQLASSLSSNASSYSTFKPTRMNFKSNCTYLAQSSPNYQRGGSSTTSTLRRSLTRQHILSEIESETSQSYEEYQRSKPPTLKNLLEPLQAQLKRPQTPRTAHRKVVSNLRNKLESYFDDPKLDQDETRKEESPEEEENQIIRGGIGMLTLDGIDDDDPFVSIETRRALGSQFINSPITPSSTKANEESFSDHDTDDELTNMDFNPSKPFIPSTSSTSSVTSKHMSKSEDTYSPKILLASNGAKLSLIESDINKFENSNQSIEINSNWITKISLQNEKVGVGKEEEAGVRIRVSRLNPWIENLNGKEKSKEKVGLGRKKLNRIFDDDDDEVEEEDWI